MPAMAPEQHVAWLRTEADALLRVLRAVSGS
jgi:hypothetical protein